MAIQIEQKMPRCLRCGKLVHFRAEERIEDGVGLFCSPICRDEYVELTSSARELAGSAQTD